MKNNYLFFITLIIVSLYFITGCGSSAALTDDGVTTVDNLRLDYNQNNVQSNQVGLTASADGSWVAFAYENGTIKVLDLTRGRTVNTHNVEYNDLFELRFDKHREQLIIVSDETVVQIVDARNGDLLHRIDLPHRISKLAVSNVDNYIAFGMWDAIVQIYDLNDYSLVNEIDGNKHHVSGLAFDPNGEKIAVSVMSSLRSRNDLNIYNIQSGEIVHTIEKGMFTDLSYTKDGEELIVARFSSNIFKPASEVWAYELSTGRYNKLFGNINWISLSLFTSMEVFENHFIGSTEDQSLTVVDLNTSDIVYTTKRDGFKLGQRFGRMGIDSKRIYPLGNSDNYLINYSDNNISQIYNAREGRIVAYLYSDANEDWALVARDGRMTGTQNAVENVMWTRRGSFETVSLDATFDQFYTPELPGLLLSIEFGTASVESVERSIEGVPEVQIITPGSRVTSSDSEITIVAEITNMGGGVGEVRLMHNGSNISGDLRGFRMVGSEGESITREFSVPLLPGENRFRLTAFNDARIESSPSEVIVDYAGAERSSDLHILAIGIDEYQNSRYNLNYGRSDAEAFASIFEQEAGGIYNNVQVTRIYDGDATRANIQAAIEQIQQTARPEDTFMFFYAGHGVVNEPINPSDRPDFYIALHDVTQLYGQEEQLKQRGIAASELTDWVSDVQARRQMVVIDACQAGGAIDAFAFRGAAEERAIQQLARSAGVAVLASAESEQFATEFEQLGHGVFTYALLNGLQGGAILGGQGGSVTVQNLISYINQNLPDLTQQHRGQTQYPVSFSRGQDFPLMVRE